MPEIGHRGESISSCSRFRAADRDRVERGSRRDSGSDARIAHAGRRGGDNCQRIDITIQQLDGDRQGYRRRLDQAEGAWRKRIADANGLGQRNRKSNPISNGGAHTDALRGANPYPDPDPDTRTHRNTDARTYTGADACTNTDTDTNSGSRHRLRAPKWQPACAQWPNLPLRRTEHL